MKNSKFTHGFTLVELIVVITILAILGTIGFISLQNYTSYARDGVRITDMRNIKTVLTFYATKNGFYPEPDGAVQITYSGSTVWNQGKFGSLAQKVTKDMSEVPTDPLLGNEYTYSVLHNRKEYELGGVLESPSSFSFYENSVYALGNEHNVSSYIVGNYNGQATQVKIGTEDYILALPSVIAGDITTATLEDIASNNKLSVNGDSNIPHSYGIDIVGDKTYVKADKLVAWSGSLDTLKHSEGEMLAMMQKLQEAYTGTELVEDKKIAELLSKDTTDGSRSSTTTNYAIAVVNGALGIQTDFSTHLHSCKEILDEGEGTESGIYTIDPDGTGPSKSFSTYCDMETDGGGWTLLSKNTAGGYHINDLGGIQDTITDAMYQYNRKHTPSVMHGFKFEKLWTKQCGVEHGSKTDLAIGVRDYIDHIMTGSWGSCGRTSTSGDANDIKIEEVIEGDLMKDNCLTGSLNKLTARNYYWGKITSINGVEGGQHQHRISDHTILFGPRGNGSTRCAGTNTSSKGAKDTYLYVR